MINSYPCSFSRGFPITNLSRRNSGLWPTSLKEKGPEITYNLGLSDDMGEESDFAGGLISIGVMKKILVLSEAS